LAGEIIEEYGNDLESIHLVRGSKGQFEVMVDEQPVYSKKETQRHANPGEVVENIRHIKGLNNSHTDAGSSLHL